MSDHSPKKYIKIWAILLGLLIVSVLGPMLEIQWVTLITAFGIALVKARLVVKHFMHIDVEAPYIKYLMVVCLAFMVLLFAGVAPDVMEHEGQNWTNDAAKANVEANTHVDAAEHH
jgi:caa(3)-type oxidase subunit IV